MHNDILKATPIKTGKCVYSYSSEYEVKIVKWHVFYGTGDYEDPVEIRNDKNIDCYYVVYEDLVKKGQFNAGGGVYFSVEEAIASVESNSNVFGFPRNTTDKSVDPSWSFCSSKDNDRRIVRYSVPRKGFTSLYHICAVSGVYRRPFISRNR